MPKTAVITPLGLFEFVQMSFGLQIMAQIFQRFVDQVLHGQIYNYIGDLLIASEDSEEHKIHLRMVFEWLQDHRILINPSKCELGIPQLQLLGHQIVSQGIHPLLDKLQVVREFPEPTTTRRVREFLGLVNFYHHFLPNAARILQSLHKSLGATKRGSIKLQWSSEATLALNASK